MRVRLIKKLAQMIDGVDLRDRSVGDVFNLTPRDGKLLIAEQWAVGGGDSRRDVFAATGACARRMRKTASLIVAAADVPDRDVSRLLRVHLELSAGACGGTFPM